MLNTISFDIEQGSIGDKIAGYTLLALLTTSADGLTDLANLANNYAELSANTVLNTPDKIAALVTDEITKLLDNTGALEQLNDGINSALNMIELLKKGLDIASATSGVIGNVTNIIASDPDITCVPSVKDSMNTMYASARDIIVGKYNETKLQFVSKYNQLMCASQDGAIDSLVGEINDILSSIPLIDTLMKEHTGYTISEVLYTCNKGIALFNMLKRVSQTNMKSAEAKKKAEQTKDKIADNASQAANNIKDNADKIKEDAKKQAKEQFEKLSEDFDKDEIKAKLFDWINELSVALLNAFSIIMIKDMIDNIKVQIQHMQNTSIENLADFCNVLNACLDIFDLLGITESAQGITKDDVMNILSAAGKINGIPNISDILNTATSVMQGAQDSAQSIRNNATTQAATALSNAKSSANNVATSSIANAKNTISKQSVFTTSTKTDGTETTIDIVIKDLTNKQDFINYLSNFKLNNGKQVFSNGTKLSFANKIADSWNKEENTEFTIIGKEGELSRNYIIKTNILSISSDSDISVPNIGDTSDQINNVANDVSLSSFKLFTQAISSVKEIGNSIDPSIDTNAIKSIIDGKILMVDEVVQTAKTLFPVIKTVLTLCHVVENYQINKEYELSQAETNIADIAKKVADTYLGLKDIINLDNTNFCTVRSKEMSDFCINTLNAQPNESGTAVINQIKTTELIKWMRENDISNDFNIALGTTLYFDEYGIKHGNKKDNTYDDLDTIEYIPSAKEIRYDKQNRSTISSQVLRAIKHGEEPFVNTNISADNINSLSDLDAFIEAISFESDEFDGQLSINTQDLNLCAPGEVLDTLEGIPGMSVIEFGDEYTLGDKVPYTLNVKPGDTIDDKTILAYIKKDGKDVPVRSKFSAGIIKATDDGKDYFHIYPTSCKDHIVIVDTSIGAGVDFNSEDVSIFGQRMKANSQIYNLILNNIVYATYPIILNNAKRDNEEIISETSNAYIDIIDKAYNQYEDDIKSFDGDKLAENIKGAVSNVELLTKIKDALLKFRDDMLAHQILYYNLANHVVTNGDSKYEDCKHLAYGSQSLFDMHQLSDSMLSNYYLSLLARLDLSDKKYETDTFVSEYHKLLTGIIDNRLQSENYSILEVIDEFDKLFSKCITTKYKESSAYMFVKNKFIGNDYSYDSIFEIIKGFSYKTFDNNEETNKSMTDMAVSLLTNMFLYIKHTESFNLNKAKQTSVETSSLIGNLTADVVDLISLKSLVNDEATKLKNFWDDMLIKYRTVYDLDTITNDIENYAKNANAIADWPMANKLRVGSYTCDLYTFTNPHIEKVPMPEIDLSGGIPETINLPEPTYDLGNIQDIVEPKIGDITILDYEYWLVYMLNATLFTLIPLYWADGLDIPPFMTPTPLPAIYLPIAPPIFIKPLNLLIVFGIALRGIYPAPIILMINLSTHALNAMTPVMTILEAVKGGLEQTIELAESAIPKLVDGVLNGFNEESTEMKKRLEKFKTYAELIKSIPIEDKALIQREFQDAVYKEYDKRQVVTRLDKLGTGPDPM